MCAVELYDTLLEPAPVKSFIEGHKRIVHERLGYVTGREESNETVREALERKPRAEIPRKRCVDSVEEDPKKTLGFQGWE